MEQTGSQSDVSHLLEQIEREYQAAQAAFSGYAVTARHAFINARLEHMGQVHDQLQQLIGADAIKLIAERLETLPE